MLLALKAGGELPSSLNDILNMLGAPSSFLFLVVSLLIVVRPGASSSILAPRVPGFFWKPWKPKVSTRAPPLLSSQHATKCTTKTNGRVYIQYAFQPCRITPNAFKFGKTHPARLTSECTNALPPNRSGKNIPEMFGSVLGISTLHATTRSIWHYQGASHPLHIESISPTVWAS